MVFRPCLRWQGGFAMSLYLSAAEDTCLRPFCSSKNSTHQGCHLRVLAWERSVHFSILRSPSFSGCHCLSCLRPTRGCQAGEGTEPLLNSHQPLTLPFFLWYKRVICFSWVEGEGCGGGLKVKTGTASPHSISFIYIHYITRLRLQNAWSQTQHFYSCSWQTLISL